MNITADKITELLKQRHKSDVCVPECATDARWRNCLRFDFWVMKKSWYSPKIIGYEIKVSRSDFLADKKWPGYLAYCNEFYFVCPNGMIDQSELPGDVGLLYVTKSGNRLRVVRSSAHRQIDIEKENSIYKYVLMARA